jgi:hypothetical protein
MGKFVKRMEFAGGDGTEVPWTSRIDLAMTTDSGSGAYSLVNFRMHVMRVASLWVTIGESLL